MRARTASHGGGGTRRTTSGQRPRTPRRQRQRDTRAPCSHSALGPNPPFPQTDRSPGSASQCKLTLSFLLTGHAPLGRCSSLRRPVSESRQQDGYLPPSLSIPLPLSCGCRSLACFSCWLAVVCLSVLAIGIGSLASLLRQTARACVCVCVCARACVCV